MKRQTEPARCQRSLGGPAAVNGEGGLHRFRIDCGRGLGNRDGRHDLVADVARAPNAAAQTVMFDVLAGASGRGVAARMVPA